VTRARELIDRRVPQILAIFAGASWGLVEFTAFAVDEFLLSPHWTRMVLIMLLVMLPSVFLLAWFHGKPGKDRKSLARTEKIGIPANLVVCVVMLAALFGGAELGSVTTAITVETEYGETLERERPKTEFTKTTALFPLDLGPGMSQDESWVSYAVPEALTLDLLADEFFVAIPSYGAEVKERGFENFAAAPLTLKRELAQESYAAFMAIGEIDRVDELFRIALRVYRVDSGSLAGETVHEGTDLLALVDEMSGPVKRALEIPVREGVEDLPVRSRLSENAAAVDAFFKGVFRDRVHQDTEGAIEYLTTATTLDPSFTVAQYTLFLVFEGPRKAPSSARRRGWRPWRTYTECLSASASRLRLSTTWRLGSRIKWWPWRRCGSDCTPTTWRGCAPWRGCSNGRVISRVHWRPSPRSAASIQSTADRSSSWPRRMRVWATLTRLCPCGSSMSSGSQEMYPDTTGWPTSIGGAAVTTTRAKCWSGPSPWNRCHRGPRGSSRTSIWMSGDWRKPVPRTSVW